MTNGTTEPAAFDRLRGRIEAALDAHLPNASALSQRLIDAMRYSGRSGGKRIRPLLACATCESLGHDAGIALAPACAVELVHAYSLVHDDLPAMDDDVMRRGQPTCHVAFDEATAILAGDALLTSAFEILAGAPDLAVETRLEMIRVLAVAAGWRGMIGGQALDVEATGTGIDLPTLERMHGGKTGALLCAAVELGALAGRATCEQYEALSRFGTRIGLAFQIVDDLLDATGTTAQLGKTAGTDAKARKSTFASLLGVAAARERADALLSDALVELARARISGVLPELAQYIVRRSR